MNATLPALLAIFAAGICFAADKPNVVLLLTDDQGYGELSCHGNPVLRTPHLDALHEQSVRFTDFHVAPMCTPTRGQILSGLDAARNGAINVSSGRTLLRAGLPTLANFLAGAGYRTGIFGKWHLGDNFPYRPQDRGFQESLWFPSSHVNSTPDFWDNDYFDDTYRRNGELQKYPGYCTDVFFGEAMAWMKSCIAGEKPFFVYLPANAPHSPHWVPSRYREEMAREFAAAESSGKVPAQPAGRRAELISYLAMIRHLDDNVGKLDAFLREAGAAENTILIFLTDNGSTFGWCYYDAGMRGKKTELWEGGHRVPCFFRWPAGNLGPPRDVGGLAQAQDLLPTILDLCGVSRADEPPLDGMSLAPALRGTDAIPEDRMLVINYSRMPFGFEFAAPDSPSRMRREGAGVLWKRWRLLEDRELYDLESDPMQTTNLIDRHPEIAGRMRAHLNAWWERVGDQANEPQRIVIGAEAENPMMLTACEWLDVFIDQQRQVRHADLKNGWWELEVGQAGEYEFELRRWPREADLPLSAGLPATAVADGNLAEGVALSIASARLKLGNQPTQMKPVKPAQKSAVFTARLEPGPIRLYTWFDDAKQQPLLGAYYVYLRRK